MFDILGFKEFLHRFEAEDALETVAILRNLLQAPVDAYGRAYGHVLLFSDTLLLYSWDDKAISFEKTIIASARFVSQAIRLGFPVRGAVGHGTFLHDADEDAMLLVGTAIVNAYDWERRQEWVGAMVSPECWSFAQPILTAEHSVGMDFLCEYEVPLKEGTGERFQAIDWTKLGASTEGSQEIQEKVDSFLSTTRSRPRDHAKWVNTNTFWADRAVRRERA